MLGKKAQTNENACCGEPKASLLRIGAFGVEFEAAHKAARGAQHEQNQQGIRIVEAKHQGCNRGECEQQTCCNASPVAPIASGDGVAQVRAANAHERLGQQDGKRAESQNTNRKSHEPNSGGWFVYCDGVTGIERTPEKRLPVLSSCLRGSAVEPIGVARGVEVP